MTRTGFAQAFLGDSQDPMEGLTGLLRQRGGYGGRTGVELEGGFVWSATMDRLRRAAAQPKECVE